MTKRDIMLSGVGSAGCRLVKEYRERNPGKLCIFNTQEEEPFAAPQQILGYKPACTVIVAGLGGKAGSTFAPEIAKHAKEYGRVFGVITLPFPFEKQRRERAMEALGRLQEHTEAVFITDLGKIARAVPASAIMGDVMYEVNEKILDALYALYEAHQADHNFSVDSIKKQLPQGFIEVK